MAEWYLANWVWDTTTGPAPHWRPPTGAIAALDFRPEAACAAAGGAPSGYGLFGFNSTQAFPNSQYFGNNLLGTLNNTRKNNWRTLLSFGATALAASRLDLVIAETLGDKSDATWTTRAKPIIPSSAGRLEIWLAGAKIYDRDFGGAADAFWPKIQAVEQDGYRQMRNRCLLLRAAVNNAVQGDGSGADRLITWYADKNGVTYEQARAALFQHFTEKYKRYLGGLRAKYLRFGLLHTHFIPNDLTDEGWLPPETTITESFNKADSSTLGPDLSWTELEGDSEVISNQGSMPPSAGTARADSDLSSADHYAEVDIVSLASHVFNEFDSGVMCRKDSSATMTFYRFCGADFYTEKKWSIDKVVSGTRTNLALSGVDGFTANDTVKGECNGTSLAVYREGVSKATVTDSSIASGTRCGITGRDTSGFLGRHPVDNFVAADLAAAATPRLLALMGVGT